MLKIIASVLALTVLTVSSRAGVEGTTTYLQDHFDVAGVSLGMQPARVFLELEKRGYRMNEIGDYTDRGPSFDELVQIKAGHLNESNGRESWRHVTFKRGTSEGVHVVFKPLPTGTAASQIYYANMAPTMTRERFMKATERKFGRPMHTRGNNYEAYWSNIALLGGSFDVAADAIQLTATAGPASNGSSAFQRVKGSITLQGGKIHRIDPEKIAENWTEEPETTF